MHIVVVDLECFRIGQRLHNPYITVRVVKRITNIVLKMLITGLVVKRITNNYTQIVHVIIVASSKDKVRNVGESVTTLAYVVVSENYSKSVSYTFIIIGL